MNNTLYTTVLTTSPSRNTRKSNLSYRLFCARPYTTGSRTGPRSSRWLSLLCLLFARFAFLLMWRSVFKERERERESNNTLVRIFLRYVITNEKEREWGTLLWEWKKRTALVAGEQHLRRASTRVDWYSTNLLFSYIIFFRCSRRGRRRLGFNP